MPAPPLPDNQIEIIRKVYEETGRNKALTASRLGIHRNTVHKYVTDLDNPRVLEDAGPQEKRPEYKLRFTVRPKQDQSLGRYRVVGVGDFHSSPSLSPERATWIGRHIHEWGAKYEAEDSEKHIVQIGDFLSLDSLCRFEPNDTLSGQLKPSFEQDIEAGHRDMKALDDGLQGFQPIKHITLGNHEDRCLSFTNRNPEIWGILTGMLDNLFMSHGWTYSPFGQFYFLGGVGFIHCPLTGMGKPFAGKTALQRAGNELTHDMVCGHYHKPQDLTVAKLGANQRVRIVDLGCSLPHGHLESYIKHDQPSGWGYGIYELLIDEGRIQSAKHISMLELEEHYA